MNAAQTAPRSFIERPILWGIAWLIAFLVARVVLEMTTLGVGLRIAAALLPIPIAAVALYSVVRGARQLDELEQRIQLEALAFAFILSVLMLMTLGLLDLAIALNPNDWSYRHVWAIMPTLYFIGLALARRRYA